MKNQINTTISVSGIWLENLVYAVKDILDSVRWHDNISDLESEESAAQKKNQPGRGLEILRSNQILLRLPISLAQSKAGNNSEKLKMKFYYSWTLCTDHQNLKTHLYKSFVAIS